MCAGQDPYAVAQRILFESLDDAVCFHALLENADIWLFADLIKAVGDCLVRDKRRETEGKKMNKAPFSSENPEGRMKGSGCEGFHPNVYDFLSGLFIYAPVGGKGIHFREKIE